MENGILSFLYAIILLFLVIAFFRSVFLWYWKINKIVESLDKTNEQNEKIINLLTSIDNSLKE